MDRLSRRFKEVPLEKDSVQKKLFGKDMTQPYPRYCLEFSAHWKKLASLKTGKSYEMLKWMFVCHLCNNNFNFLEEDLKSGIQASLSLDHFRRWKRQRMHDKSADFLLR